MLRFGSGYAFARGAVYKLGEVQRGVGVTSGLTVVWLFDFDFAMKNAVSLACGALLTGLALTYALWNVEFQELWRVLGDLDYSALLPFLSLLAVFFWLKAVRWATILRPLGSFTARQVTPALMIGFAGNNVLPARLGELLRTIILARRFKKSYSGVFATVGVDRLLDVVAILIIYAIATSLLDDLPETVRIGALIGLGLASTALLLIAVILWQFRRTLDYWRRISTQLPARFREVGEKLLHNVAEAVSTLRSPRLVAFLIGNSLCQWGVMTCNIWIAMWAFGTTISVGTALFVMVVTALAVSVPSIPGYIGPIQAAFVFALGPFGIAPETALAGSIFFLVAQWIPVTAVGVWFFAISGFGVAEIRQEAEQIERSSSPIEHEQPSSR